MAKLIASKKGMIIKGTILCTFAALLLLYVRYRASLEETKRISIEVQEGTELAFDLSSADETIAFDLLGQIWVLPSQGGEAKPITDSIRENAEHLYPAFTAVGKRIVFWESRPSSWGLTSMGLDGGERRTLTELSTSENDSYNDRFFACSPARSEIAFTREGKLMLISDEERGTPRELKVEGLPRPGIKDPAYSPDGSKLAFVNAPAIYGYTSHSGGSLWQVRADGGKAEALSDAKTEVRAPCYSPDGRRIAYFVRNEDLSFEIWVSGVEGDEPRKLAGQMDITPHRMRWTPEGKDLVYCAAGRFWKISAEGGPAQEIPFTARLGFSLDRPKLKSVQFPKPQQRRVAHGHMGLEISPEGKTIAAIALGRLWVWDVGKKPTAVTELPLSASGLCWSPDNHEVAWSAGVAGSEDLFATHIQSGHTRRLTAIRGTEVRASWSPDGKHIAFIHRKSLEQIRQGMATRAPGWNNFESLRALKVSDAPVGELAQTLELQTYQMYGQSLILSRGLYWGRPWSPDSKYLLGESEGRPALISLEGKIIPLKDSKEFPSEAVPLWESSGSLLYTMNFSLWRSPWDTLVGMTGESVPVSQDAVLYPSGSDNGSLLYVSSDGLCLRRTGGQVDRLGWPLSYETADAPEPLFIHNVRIINGTGAAITQPCDILIEGGRISRIAPSGRLQAPRNMATIEGDGRVVIPGMIDAHMHEWDQILLPELLYEGITTVRDMGTQLAWAKGFQESIEAGLLAGPRIVLGGFLGGSIIQPSLMGSSRPMGIPDGVDGAIRALSLARAFEFDFIKMYLPVNPSSGAEFIRMAHEQGFPVSSHYGYPLPVVASRIDSKEHTGRLSPVTPPRIAGVLQDDIIQLVKQSGMGIVPTLSTASLALAAADGSFAKEAGDSLFLCGWRAFNLLYPQMPDAYLKPYRKNILVGRENVARLHRAGISLAAGTDIPMSWMPWSLHRELEEFVASGLSPLDAITTATLNAARVLRAEKETGSIEEGKLADVVILDASPLEDIKNTRKIWKVIQGGKVADREALENWLKRETKAVENIGRERQGP